MNAHNLFAVPSDPAGTETLHTLVEREGFCLEQIISRGAVSPEGLWYDQARDEWVMLLRGTARIRFESGDVVDLSAGDSLHIAAHHRHRVEQTSLDAVWLALHFNA